MFSAAPNAFGGEPNTNIDPVTPGPARVAAGGQPPGRRAGHPGGAGPPLHGAARRPSPARTTSTRTCPRTTRSASTTSRSTSTAGSSCPTARASASSGPTSRRTPASRRTRAATVASTGPSRRSSTTTGPASRSSRSSGRPDLRSGRRRPGLRAASCGPSSWPSAPPTARWRRGRCGSTPTCRCARSAPTSSALRCEIKNVNSLRSLGRAIEYEARRQVDVIEAGERVRQETRHWDEEAGRTRAGRSKEEAEDYRYFLEPDLVVLDPSPEWIESIRAELPRAAGRAPPAAGRRPPASSRRRWPSTSTAISTTWPWPPSAPAATRAGC